MQYYFFCDFLSTFSKSSLFLAVFMNVGSQSDCDRIVLFVLWKSASTVCILTDILSMRYCKCALFMPIRCFHENSFDCKVDNGNTDLLHVVVLPLQRPVVSFQSASGTIFLCV